MNEASVNLDFRKKLQALLPGAVIIKHYDKGMIGMPDCSVTYNGGIMWLEFKLIIPVRSWDGVIPWEKIAQKAPVQHEMVMKLTRQATMGGYVAWVNKMRYVEYWDPTTGNRCVRQSSQEMAEYLAMIFKEYNV